MSVRGMETLHEAEEGGWPSWEALVTQSQRV